MSEAVRPANHSAICRRVNTREGPPAPVWLTAGKEAGSPLGAA